MPNCAILNCENSSRVVNRENGGITYHRFPRDPVYKEKWIEATGRKDWLPSKHSTICSIHFKNCDFVITKKCRHLFETAYPTILVLCMTTNGEDSTSITATAGELKLKRQRARAKITIHKQNLKLKSLREKYRRQNKKICTLQKMLQELKKESLLNEEDAKKDNVQKIDLYVVKLEDEGGLIYPSEDI